MGITIKTPKSIMKSKILYHINPELLEDLKATDAILAGGVISSIYSGRKVEDFDIFFKSEEQNEEFTKRLEARNNFGRTYTKMGVGYIIPAYSHSINLHRIDRLIVESPKELFETFDFSVCMAAYTFKDRKFHFHKKFKEDNKNKYLRINYKSPSLLRLESRLKKYMSKGYFLYETEYLKLKMFLMSTPYSELFKRYNEYFHHYDAYNYRYTSFEGNSLCLIDFIGTGMKKGDKYGYNFIKRYSHRLSERISKDRFRYKY